MTTNPTHPASVPANEREALARVDESIKYAKGAAKDWLIKNCTELARFDVWHIAEYGTNPITPQHRKDRLTGWLARATSAPLEGEVVE